MGLPGLETELKVKFPLFGRNKCQEIVRLVHEIARREHVGAASVIDAIPSGCVSFAAVKGHLVKRRFPEATGRGEVVSETFMALDVDPRHAMPLDRSEHVPAPCRVHIEEGLERSDLARRAQALFPSARFLSMRRYKDHVAAKAFDIPAYNRRTEDLFIVREAYDHFKRCPCSPGVVPCGYHNISLGFGCPFECSYCFLQDYTNAPGIVIPANLDDFFKAFEGYRQDVRVGSGETTDSLVYDELTGFAGPVVEFFRRHPQSVFEFKTKSNKVEGLLGVKASSNIVVGWSVNPQALIDDHEHFTASLDQRLMAARRVAQHGYRTAFHFDPVIYCPGWEEAYCSLVDRLFKEVPAESMAWISVGSLRMTSLQKKTIENRFPDDTILDAELLAAEDGKLRYADCVRESIYRKVTGWLKEKMHPSTQVYLCMETAAMWQKVFGRSAGSL